MLPATGAALFALSLIVALIALPALERAGRARGIVDAPGGRKRHEGPVPLVGGIAVLLAVALPAMGGLALAILVGEGALRLPPEIAVHLPGVRSKAGELLAILGGSGVMLLLGHLDDRRGLSPWTRLAVETACAAALAVIGIRVTLFLPGAWLHGLLTVVFIVFVTNAVNFIDNMNGLMTGVVVIGALHLLCLAAATGQLFMAALLLCLVGGLLGFLARNFPRARVFIGDAGSLAIGFLLASLTVAFTFEEHGFSLKPVLLPLCMLAVPIADGVFVTTRRLLRGVHPFTAGRDHLSHVLVARGLTPVRAVLLLWAIAFVCGLPALVLGRVTPGTALAVWLPAVVVAGVLLLVLQRRGPQP